jgi:hypothetical protein
VRYGVYRRRAAPRVIQRYRCVNCRRLFSDQTFRVSYWLRRPELLEPVFHRLVACSGFRQIAREFPASPQTVLTHSRRLGRHCLLLHETLRPRQPLREPVALDTFLSFEYSQDHPTGFHTAIAARSHYFYGFTDSELRRSGRMTGAQRRRRARIESQLGRPDPRATERDVACLLAIVAGPARAMALITDQHAAYPRAVRSLSGCEVDHRTVSSRAARTPQNPLYPVNLLDLLIRHSGANHKRETIAFSKRRQGAADRLWLLLVWRNYVKPASKRIKHETPAMRAGVVDQPLSVHAILQQRQFPSRIRLPERWATYYRSETPTRRISRCARHEAKLAF